MDLTSLKKRCLLLLLFLCLLPLASSCRTRVIPGAQDPADAVSQSGEARTGLPGDASDTGAVYAQSGESTEAALESDGERSARTRENPEASVREFDEKAPAEIVGGTERILHTAGEGSGAPVDGDESSRAASQTREESEETATQTVPAEEAEEAGVSEDAEEAESAMTYFTVLLKDRMDSVFECQRANVYWETAQDHVTVHKSSPEHALILASGAYDVSSRLLPENLKVNDGWVMRKNPQVIVKAVDSSVLGNHALSTDAAERIRRELLLREEWNTIDAVRSGQVVLLSEELLEAPYLQTAAMLMIAKTANPALFEDVDPAQALEMLSEEATGTLPAGIYFYSGS